MGNGIGKIFLCSAGTGAGDSSVRLENRSAFVSKQHDKAIGNSLCYVRPIPPRFSGNSLSDDETTIMTFRSVTGATVSANCSATPSIFLDDSLQHSTILDSSASFESFGSFASTMVPFQYQLHHQHQNQHAPIRRRLKKILSRAFLSFGKRSILKKNDNANARVSCSTSLSGELRLQDDDDSSGYDDLLMVCKNLHWAQGKAGEDRMHIVICENHEWVFVGIYDGFNGPDATDYLLNTLFYAVYDELRELLCSHNDVLKDNDVLQCLSEGLRKTEEAFLKNVNDMITHNPVLAMMGSCVLVMLMKGEDVYLMNVGDSRAVLATHTGNSLQLTMEHSTYVKEVVCATCSLSNKNWF